MTIDLVKRTFQFTFNARTSRGAMKDKQSWFIILDDDGRKGIGECGPLPGLSPDDKEDYEKVLQTVIDHLPKLILKKDFNIQDIKQIVPEGYPSITFGLETALLDYFNGGTRTIFNNSFLRQKPIPINGLVWMGDQSFMKEQIDDKIHKGFKCIKLKVGGIDFERECELLSYIRQKYADQNLTIRLVANGAFNEQDVFYKLKKLAPYAIHSIEQPVKPGLSIMEAVCKTSPIPIAFGEELIGITNSNQMVRLLEKLRPQYIVLKPTLHGGLQKCSEWIELATSLGIGWWITSMLESNIGLNAICQFVSNYELSLPQGLGTGLLYNNNIPSPLKVRNGTIYHEPSQTWDLSSLLGGA